MSQPRKGTTLEEDGTDPFPTLLDPIISWGKITLSSAKFQPSPCRGRGREEKKLQGPKFEAKPVRGRPQRDGKKSWFLSPVRVNGSIRIEKEKTELGCLPCPSKSISDESLCSIRHSLSSFVESFRKWNKNKGSKSEGSGTRSMEQLPAADGCFEGGKKFSSQRGSFHPL